MKYSDDYMYAKDIDWFCVINDNYIHAASAGGILPEPINDREKLRKLKKQSYYKSLEKTNKKGQMSS